MGLLSDQALSDHLKEIHFDFISFALEVTACLVLVFFSFSGVFCAGNAYDWFLGAGLFWSFLKFNSDKIV